jgi:hypothetical protein
MVLSVSMGMARSSLFNVFTKTTTTSNLPVQKDNYQRYRDVYPLYWKAPPCAQPAPVIDRYLLMSKRNGGWNNERMIMENAIIMAWLTNRTLVLPNRLRYDHMHGEETFEKFVDFSYLRCFVPIIDSSELPRLTSSKIDVRFQGADRAPETYTADIEFNSATFAYPAAPTTLTGATYDDFLEFEAFRTGRDVVHQLMPDDGELTKLVRHLDLEPIRVEVVDNTQRFLNSKNHFFCLYYAFYWFQDKAMHNRMIDYIKHGTHYQEKLYDAALAIIQDLGRPGTFSTVHIRSRDFRHQSGYYQYFKVRSWIENFRSHHSNTFHPNERVYISTDERNITEIKVFQKQLDAELGVRSSTIYDFFDKLNIDNNIGSRRWEFWGDKKIETEQASQFNLNDLGAIEQIVCAHGRRYIATYFSTFSAHIMRLRGYLPFDDIVKNEHLFWDRTLSDEGKCTWDSIPENCEPSWGGQFRGAMWASEFEEGWLPYEELIDRRKRLRPENRIPEMKHAKRFEKSERDAYEMKSREHRKSNDDVFGGRRGRHGRRDRDGFLKKLKTQVNGNGL